MSIFGFDWVVSFVFFVIFFCVGLFVLFVFLSHVCVFMCALSLISFFLFSFRLCCVLVELFLCVFVGFGFFQFW